MRREESVRPGPAAGGVNRGCGVKCRWTGSAVLVVVLAIQGLGCGGSDNESQTVAATSTPTATPTVAATPTSTPLPVIAGQENLFGSSAQGSGALTIEPLPLIPAYFDFCLGSADPNCAGGTLVYVGTDPGFKEADDSEADPSHSLYALPDGVTVTLEVVSIDPALSLVFNCPPYCVAGSQTEGVTLNAPQQTLLLGTTPGIHADLAWELSMPAGQPITGHAVTFKLTTTTGGFTDSVEFTETVEASTGTAPAGDD